MSKPPKSQWDFGELFPVASTRKILSVSELTSQVRALIERQIGQVWVSGEITNLRAQSSGHLYFTLKDAEAQLSCVLFNREKVEQRSLLADGLKVLLRGDLTVYEPRGQYQLMVRGVELQGVGALQVAFENLKRKLAAEGLFAPERKRPLPLYPKRLGVVTSLSGAAIRDVVHVVQRRHPALEIILAPARVQGAGAAEEIAAAIRLLNEFSAAFAEHGPDGESSRKIDLLLVTRGGGSLEDLWAFNEEAVARAIFESQIPVVSAVGHEIDFCISDFVADLRAATPSAAAEIITSHFVASHDFVAEASRRLTRAVRRTWESAQRNTQALSDRLARVHPRRSLDAHLQRLDDLQASLLRQLKSAAMARAVLLETLAARFGRARPSLRLKSRRESLHQLERRLNALGPEQVLARGYSITVDDATGMVLRQASQTVQNQRLRTRLQSGEIHSRVTKS